MYLDDLKLNTEINLPEVTISKERMLEFAQIYDPLPLHCDEEYAKTTRFGQLVAPGVMTFMTVWAEIVKTDLFGDELISCNRRRFGVVVGDDAEVGCSSVLTAGCIVERGACVRPLTRVRGFISASGSYSGEKIRSAML